MVADTSGTTGTPKGVMVTHGPLLSRTSWMRRAYPIGPDDVVSCKTQFIFGVSEWELFYTLTSGAQLALVPQSIVASPDALARSIVAHRAAVVFLIPSHLNALIEPLARHVASRSGGGQSRKWRRWVGSGGKSGGGKGGGRLSLRHVVCCGEAMRPEIVRRFHTQLATTPSRVLGGAVNDLVGIGQPMVHATPHARVHIRKRRR